MYLIYHTSGQQQRASSYKKTELIWIKRESQVGTHAARIRKVQIIGRSAMYLSNDIVEYHHLDIVIMNSFVCGFVDHLDEDLQQWRAIEA